MLELLLELPTGASYGGAWDVVPDGQRFLLTIQEGKNTHLRSNETGRYEVYARPFPGPGGKWQVSTGGSYPRWRRDGQELFYVAPDNRMMAVPIQGAADGRTLTPGAPVALFPARLVAGGGGIGGSGSRAEFAVAASRAEEVTVRAEETDSNRAGSRGPHLRQGYGGQRSAAFMSEGWLATRSSRNPLRQPTFALRATVGTLRLTRERGWSGLRGSNPLE